MKKQTRENLDKLMDANDLPAVQSLVKTIVETGDVPVLLAETKKLTPFQKYYVISSISSGLNESHLHDLLNLLEEEAAPYFGREEATFHLNFKKQLVKKITELSGSNVLDNINLIDEEKIKDAIQELRRQKNNS